MAVRVGFEFSKTYPCINVAPQGGVLSPRSFHRYTADRCQREGERERERVPKASSFKLMLTIYKFTQVLPTVKKQNNKDKV